MLFLPFNIYIKPFKKQKKPVEFFQKTIYRGLLGRYEIYFVNICAGYCKNTTNRI